MNALYSQTPNFLNPGAANQEPKLKQSTPPVHWARPARTPAQTKRRRLWYVSLGLAVLVATGASAAYYLTYGSPKPKPAAVSPAEQRLNFLLEIYDQVKIRYWDKITDDQLTTIYQRATEKLTNQLQQLDQPNRAGLVRMLQSVLKPMSDADQKTFVVSLGDTVLANLNPFGRSRLYTTKSQQALMNEVKNIDPGANLYQSLGVDKTASAADISQAYQKKSAELKASKAPDAAAKLAAVSRAYQALGNPEAKKQYDQTGAEPTVTGKIVRGSTLDLTISRISPTTVPELAKVSDSFGKNSALKYLVLDLRGDIGGDIDILPYFLGLFVGPNQYAYQFYHQGDTQPQATKVGWLPSLARFTHAVVLIDNQTQSSAEVIADTLKKYHIGVLVGATSKGWGTVESVVPLQTVIDPAETYSMLLVHSVTVRDDGQAIEGRGVVPQVKLSDPTWPNQLLSYYNFPDFIAAVREIATKP